MQCRRKGSTVKVAASCKRIERVGTPKQNVASKQKDRRKRKKWSEGRGGFLESIKVKGKD